MLSARWRWLGVPLLLVAVFVASSSAVTLAPVGTQVASWWPGAGLATALLLMSGVRRWPLALALLAVVTGLGNVVGGRDLDVAAIFGVGNGLEALAAALVLGAHRRRPTLSTSQDLVRLCVAALVGAAVVATVAASTVVGLQGAPFWDSARHVMAAHLAAQLVVLPLALSAGATARADVGTHQSPARAWVGTAALTATVFAIAFLGWEGIAASAFLPLPAMVWVALVLPRREVFGLMLGVGVLTTMATARGQGPLAEQAAMALDDGTLLAQLYLVVLFLITVPLVLLVEQRTSALATTEAVLASTTESAIIATDVDGRIRFFNVGAERMLGWELAEVVGRRPDEVFVDPGDVAAFTAGEGVGQGSAGMRELLTRQGGVLKRDWPWHRKDGSALVASVCITEVRSPTGELEGHLSVALDVTERLLVKQRLREALARERASVAELERVTRLEGEFVSAVSHELRTPLTTILGNTQLLAAHIPGPLSEDQERVVERLHRSGRRLLMLVEDLLTLTALESRVATRHVELRAGDVLAQVRSHVEDLLEGRDLHLEHDDAAGDAVVLGDADELERALHNLVGNAIKFTPDGGRIRVASHREDDCLVWSVSDTGLGVSEQDRRHLFERFFRAGTVTAMAIPGTGLGLAIVQLIAQAHGGSVRYVPHEGAGSTFELRLPVAPVSTSAAPTAAQPSAPLTAAPPTSAQPAASQPDLADDVRLGEPS